MAALTLLGIGAALGGAALFARKKNKKSAQLTGAMPNLPPRISERPRKAKSAEAVALATAPPDPIKAASDNTQQAGIMAQKTRRRAAAGNAGRVSTGPVSNAQKAIGNAGQRSTLGGY